jgi:nucleoside-diphosphate-sugar epimerase
VAAWGRLARLRLLPVVYGLEMCFVHVDDLVNLVADVLERADAPVGPFFVSDGECHRMERVADLVERLAGAPPAVRLPLGRGLLELAGSAAERLARATGIGALAARSLGELQASGWACVPDEACAELGFEPRHHLADGLPEVFAWYRSHGWI